MNTATTTAVHTANGDMTTTLARPNGSPLPPSSSSTSKQDSAPPSPTKQAGVRSSSKYKHVFAIHAESKASPFSQDATTSPSNFGFRNLMGLIIVISNLRLMVENFKKYGILVTLSGAEVSQSDQRWFWILYALTPCHLFVAYLIESMAARYAEASAKRKHETQQEKEIDRKKANASWFSTWRMIAMSHAVNATFMLAFATYVVYYGIHNPGLGAMTELHAVIVWLKVW
jgi:diacylglycerol O-acyltransferase-1